MLIEGGALLIFENKIDSRRGRQHSKATDKAPAPSPQHQVVWEGDVLAASFRQSESILRKAGSVRIKPFSYLARQRT